MPSPPKPRVTTIAIETATEDHLLEVQNDGVVIVRLHNDGTVEIPDLNNVDEAARLFWEAVGRLG